MAHPKAMYKQTSKGMTQESAMSTEEQSEFVGKGWSTHPEEARLAYKNANKKKPEAKKERKPLIEMDKDELKAYAETLGVKLNKTKSLANMMKELEEMLK
jgi:hypothetical protein